jgi:hypothetical protein
VRQHYQRGGTNDKGESMVEEEDGHELRMGTGKKSKLKCHFKKS